MSDEKLKLLSIKLGSLASLAFDIVSRIVELDYVVSSDLPQDSFQDDIRPLLGIEANFEILKRIFSYLPLLSKLTLKGRIRILVL